MTWCIFMSEVLTNLNYEFGQWQCWHSHCIIQKHFNGYKGYKCYKGHKFARRTLPTPSHCSHHPIIWLVPNSDLSIYNNLNSSECQWSNFDVPIPGEHAWLTLQQWHIKELVCWNKQAEAFFPHSKSSYNKPLYICACRFLPQLGWPCSQMWVLRLMQVTHLEMIQTHVVCLLAVA